MPRNPRRLTPLLFVVSTVAVATFFAWHFLTTRSPQEEVEIYRGVYYRAVDLAPTGEARGLAHIVRVDLTAPGVDLYVTPLDPDAVKHGQEYRLALPSSVAKRENLAVTVNGAIFTADSRYLTLPGDFAVSSDTVVADHVPNHCNPHSYLVYFDDALAPHMLPTKPPTADALRAARWGIADGMPLIVDGRVNPYADRDLNSRTILAFDAREKTLFLAVFDHASVALAARTLVDLGATHGIKLDGGDSSTMVLGAAAKNARPGTLLNGYRPVATVVGVRARPLP